MTDKNRPTEAELQEGANAAGAKTAETGSSAVAKAGGLTTKHIVLILGALVIVCAAVIIAVLLLRAEKPAQGGVPIVDESNISDIMAEIDEKVARGMFETHMNTRWSFPDGKSPSSNAVMGNAPANNFSFWFTVTLADTGELVYTSSLLPVGSELESIVLDKDLDAGTYAAIVTIHMVDDEGAEVESNMGINITLIVSG
jgi:hypothetical protein